MSIDEFRSHKYLPSQWRKELQTNGILQLVLQVLEESSPDKYVVPKDMQEDISPTMAAIELGVTRGYSKYSARLRLLAEPKRSLTDLVGEPTYAPPPKEELAHAK